MKKILFISYDGMTDPLGQSQVVPYLQGLSKRGYQFYILSCEKPAAYKKNESQVKKMLEGFSIEWHPIAYTKKPPVLSTLKDIINLKKKAKQLHQLHSIDMVHTRPGIPSLVGLWMKKKFGLKFLHDIREFYADSRVDAGIWSVKKPLYNFIYQHFKKIEKQELSLCDGIVCLTHAAQKIILASPDYKKSIPLKVIPCSTDLSLFNAEKIDETKKQHLRQTLGIKENDFVVSYLGSIGGWYMTKEMLRFCRLLSDKKTQTKFLFISPHLHDVIADEAGKFGIPSGSLIIKHGKREEVPALLSISDYSIFFIKPCYSKLSSSPTKHGEIMAMGIPVITNSGVGDVKEIVERYNAGIVLNGFSDDDCSKAINKICDGISFNQSLIRKGAEEIYSLEKAVDEYGNLYNTILH